MSAMFKHFSAGVLGLFYRSPAHFRNSRIDGECPSIKIDSFSYGKGGALVDGVLVRVFPDRKLLNRDAAYQFQGAKPN
jgi:hypothetical protein